MADLRIVDSLSLNEAIEMLGMPCIEYITSYVDPHTGEFRGDFYRVVFRNLQDLAHPHRANLKKELQCAIRTTAQLRAMAAQLRVLIFEDGNMCVVPASQQDSAAAAKQQLLDDSGNSNPSF